MQANNTSLRLELRAKDEFIATLGHELRNPLSVLTTASQVLQMDGASRAELKHAGEIISRQVRQVTRLINDLLDLERIDHGKLMLDVQTVNLCELVSNTVALRVVDAKLRRQSLTVQLTGVPIFMDVDAVRLTQVVSNLVDNAVKYTPDDGHINVAVTTDGHEAMIIVDDDGAGIPFDRLDSIFEPFVQLSESRDAARGGMGLGLSLVRRLIELHGGTVDVTSSGLGYGSRFAVHLPRKPDGEQDAIAGESERGRISRSVGAPHESGPDLGARQSRADVAPLHR